MSKLETKICFLQAYAVIATIVFGGLVFSGFTIPSGKQRFEEIEAERINIVEKDGQVKLERV